MRPAILFPLFASVESLPGVGPRLAALIEKLCGPHVVNLIWHLPSAIVDRRYSPKIAEATEGTVATLVVHIDKHYPSRDRRRPYKIICSDDTGFMELVFFNARGDYLARQLPEGQTRVISGTLDRFNDTLQMTHPDLMGPIESIDDIKRVEPVYPLTAGLSGKVLGKAIKASLEEVPLLEEWQDPAFLQVRGFPSWKEALTSSHKPLEEKDLTPEVKVRERLAYDELLAGQLALALIRRATKKKAGRAVKGSGQLQKAVTDTLPFSLTNSQRMALAEITADMSAPERMLRLLQGDVGSGKTIVALLACLSAIEAGHQAAIMAPTEILARQHFASLSKMAGPAGLKIALLTGRDKGKARTETLEALENGTIKLIVGTHALFQEDVKFNDLALSVIDEQHRFGVHQRLALTDKGAASDILVMTATPIPRTLVLTAYGDMDVSRLTEKPAGRKPIQTVAMPMDKLPQVISGIARQIASGARIYWICPLVEESEALGEISAAEDRFKELQHHFGERVGLVHGQMKVAEKDSAMEAFTRGETDILVATTVVEVGVDVPEASVMIIEHAERFGLAQLHQLRGRVGRGTAESSCLLVYATPLGEVARARLQVMRDSEDGFKIAEEDLKLRGAGEVLGTRQSGLPTYRLASLPAHEELLAAARDDAKLILARDPDLQSERGKALRTLLYLFEKDATIAYLRSG